MALFFVLCWFLCAFMSASLAGDKERSRVGWFLIGFFMGPLGFLILLLPSLAEEDEQEEEQTEGWGGV